MESSDDNLDELLVRAVRAIASGHGVRVGDQENAIVVGPAMVRASYDAVAGLREVAETLGHLVVVDDELRRWATRADAAAAKEAARKAGNDSQVDWRPTEFLPEDFYAY